MSRTSVSLCYGAFFMVQPDDPGFDLSTRQTMEALKPALGGLKPAISMRLPLFEMVTPTKASTRTHRAGHEREGHQRDGRHSGHCCILAK